VKVHKLIDYICDELETLEKKAEKGKLSMSEMEYVDMLAHTKKNLLKGEEMMEEGEQPSYARGGRRRDAMGRYSGRRSYSYDDDMRSLADSVRSMMDDMPEETRSEARRFVQKLDRM
jgi:hypothetical protein